MPLEAVMDDTYEDIEIPEKVDFDFEGFCEKFNKFFQS
jgi:hypothetical protein